MARVYAADLTNQMNSRIIESMPIVYHFSETDLGKIRFAFSPIWECVSSLRVLRDPAMGAMHLPWIKEARANTKHLDLELLFTLVRDPKDAGNYIPDFLTPPPSTPFPDFKSELTMVRNTPSDIVQHDLAVNYHDLQTLPKNVQLFVQQPQVALEQLTDLLEQYWESCLAMHWERLRLLLEADVMLRARQLALGGSSELFNNLYSTLTFRKHKQEYLLEQEKHFTQHRYLNGRGFVLVPSAFLGAKIMSMHDIPWQPTMIYPARGNANLWNASTEPSHALEALLGDGCARVLEALHVPTGTIELAKRLAVAPGNVSHHLKRLTRAGLVESHRQGRIVYYRHSNRAERMLALYE